MCVCVSVCVSVGVGVCVCVYTVCVCMCVRVCVNEFFWKFQPLAYSLAVHCYMYMYYLWHFIVVVRYTVTVCYSEVKLSSYKIVDMLHEMETGLSVDVLFKVQVQVSGCSYSSL